MNETTSRNRSLRSFQLGECLASGFVNSAVEWLTIYHITEFLAAVPHDPLISICMPQVASTEDVSFPAKVEFEFTTWAWVQSHCKNGDWWWQPPPEWQLAVVATAIPVVVFFPPLICIHKQTNKTGSAVIGGGLRWNSGAELKLYLRHTGSTTWGLPSPIWEILDLPLAQRSVAPPVPPRSAIIISPILLIILFELK